MNEQQPYHVAFCCDDNYAKYVVITLLSIIKNNPSGFFKIFIVSEKISSNTKKYYNEIFREYTNIEIHFTIFDNSIFKSFPTGQRWPIQTWYRLLLPKLLDESISKVLYLDVDTLVTGDLSPLFSLNMINKSIAATPEVNYFNPKYYERLNYSSDKGYICAGVIMMNLEYWRKNNITEEALNWAKNNSSNLKLLDQDVLNYICRDSKIILPLKYGVVQWYFSEDNFYQKRFLTELKEALENPVIVHYAFTSPWYKDAARHIFYDLWITYNRSLNKPIQLRYLSKGILKLKYFIWDLFHPNGRRPSIEIREISKKINRKVSE